MTPARRFACSRGSEGSSAPDPAARDRVVDRRIDVAAAWANLLFGLLLGACAALPPALDAPKLASSAITDPETSRLGREASALTAGHADRSGFDLLTDGPESFALRLEMAARAERTIDAQYFIFREDATGGLVLNALLEAADRGVRVRLLIDDAEAFDKGSLIRPLAAHPNIEIRIYNPFVVRRDLAVFRWAEFLVGGRRLNYRMHNKLFVADNAIAVSGGRNVGDPYFQASNVRNLGDVDLAVVGPMVQAFSRSFDRYWNDRLAVPAESLPLGRPTLAELEACRKALADHRAKMAGGEYVSALPRRDRLADILSGGHPLVWATATLAADPPDKAQAGQNGATERLMWPGVARAVEAAKSEVIIVSPYLVPGEEEMALLRRLRERGVRVRVLTNSLASTDMPIAHAGYLHHRVALLEAGCELFEVRPVPGAPEAHGLVRSGASGQFGLHAKLIVIDGERSYVGSMNFDRRSLDINTEIGLLIDSPEIANALTRRIEAILAPTNSYRLALDRDALGATRVEWITEDDGGRMVRLDDEPDVDPAKNALIRMLSLLPIQDLL